jgi:hypothetical protein
VPLVAGIETITNALKLKIRDKPMFVINKTTRREELNQWRYENRGKHRVLAIGFSRNYSNVADEILAKPYEQIEDVLLYETKIFVCTSIIETGKTIKTLYLCFDSGFDTTSIYTPLTMEHQNKLQYLRQIPVNKNQVIQRKGRVGREAPGIYVHFYTAATYSKLLLNEIPQTINNSCLSGLLLDSLKNKEIATQINIMNENVYLFPIPIDLLITSVQDLIYSGYMTAYGENVMLRSSYESGQVWIVFVKFLYYIKKLSLFESLILVNLNLKKLPSILTIVSHNLAREFMGLEEVLKLDNSMTFDIIEGIQKSRNYITRARYKKRGPFAFIRENLFPRTAEQIAEEKRVREQDLEYDVKF